MDDATALTDRPRPSGSDPSPAAPRQVTFFLVEGFSHLAFACALEPLRIANRMSGQCLYEWSLASADGVSARCSNGIEVRVQGAYPVLGKGRQLFVLAGMDAWTRTSPELLDYLRREYRSGTELGALCSGAFIVAAAGLLDGQPVALHWEYHDSFMESHPTVGLRRNVFIADSPIISAAGGTSTADLILHLIARAHGEPLSVAIADQMVYDAVRQPTAEQRLSLQSRHGLRSESLTRAIRMMEASIEEPLALSSIARAIGLSTRQIERLFGRHLNCSPGKYFLDLRLHKAHDMLSQKGYSLTDISLACGFKSTAHFSRAYRARYGLTPMARRGPGVVRRGQG